MELASGYTTTIFKEKTKQNKKTKKKKETKKKQI